MVRGILTCDLFNDLCVGEKVKLRLELGFLDNMTTRPGTKCGKQSRVENELLCRTVVELSPHCVAHLRSEPICYIVPVVCSVILKHHTIRTALKCTRNSFE